MPLATTTIAAASAAASLGSAGASFARAAQNKRKEREAGELAAGFLKKAEDQYKTNFAEQLQVPLEGYRMAADMNSQFVAQNIEALKESGQRAILGGVAGLQRQAQEGSEALRGAMQQDLYNRDQMILQEEAQIRDRLAELNLNQATGAQEAAADAQLNKVQAIESAFGGLQQGMSTLYENADALRGNPNDKIMGELYGKSITANQKSQAERILNNMTQEELDDLLKRGKSSSSIFSMPGFTPGYGMNTSRPKTPGFKVPTPVNPFKK